MQKKHQSVYVSPFETLQIKAFNLRREMAREAAEQWEKIYKKPMTPEAVWAAIENEPPHKIASVLFSLRMHSKRLEDAQFGNIEDRFKSALHYFWSLNDPFFKQVAETLKREKREIKNI